jgi:hypothetical protein
MSKRAWTDFDLLLLPTPLFFFFFFFFIACQISLPPLCFFFSLLDEMEIL